MVDSIVINKDEPTTAEKPVEEAQVETTQEEVAATPEAEKILGKFDTQEDLEKAYKELESKIGSPKEETKEEPTLDIPEGNAEEVVEAAGLDMESLQQEFSDKGELTAESLAKLEKVGINKDIVDSYIQGQQAVAQQIETDIKSIKKAARQTVGPELEKRIQIIIDTGLVELHEDFKFYWNKSVIGKLTPGKDYLNPNFELIVDETLEPNEKKKITMFLEKWIKNKINIILKSLIDLKNLKEKNSSIKALAYQLYENNGVLKRDQVSEYLKNLGQNERKILRDLGVKFGRYHIFLYRLIKPEAVSLRTLLWKNFHQKYFDFKPPTLGLNFIDNKDLKNKNFMLLCGFEKFENFFVRIDILERLFMQIISFNSENNKEIKLIPEMLNLLGCSKDNFKKLISYMNYKVKEKNEEIFFKYIPKKIDKRKFNKETSKENPFEVLKNLNLN